MLSRIIVKSEISRSKIIRSLIRLAIVGLGLFIILFEGQLKPIPGANWSKSYGGPTSLSPPLRGDMWLGQPVQIPNDYPTGAFNFITGIIATYRETPPGDLSLWLLKGGQAPVSQEEIAARSIRHGRIRGKSLKDNSKFKWPFRDCFPTSNDKFFLLLKYSSDKPTSAIAVYLDNYSGHGAGAAKILRIVKNGKFISQALPGHLSWGLGRESTIRPFGPKLRAMLPDSLLIILSIILIWWIFAPVLTPGIALNFNWLEKLPTRFPRGWPVFLGAIVLGVVLCYHNFLAKGIAGSKFMVSGYDLSTMWTWLKLISMAGFVPIAIISQYVGGQVIVNALFGLLAVTTFWGSWKIFKSSIFSVTLTMGLLINSLQYHIYVHNTLAFILLLIYCQINIVCLVLYLRDLNRRGYLIGFFVSLALASQVWPTWLSYLSGLTLILILLAIVYFRRRDKRRLRAVVILGAISLLWGVLYVAIYLQINPSMHLPKGGSHEDEMILVYGHLINMIEDFVSNAAAYLYVSLTYFFPWPLTWSNSLVLLSPDQYSNSSGFVGQGTDITHDLHLRFLWRYVGGGLLAGYIFALVSLGKRILNSSRSDNYIYPAAFLLMIGAGSATHLLIKYRQISYIAGNEYKYMFSAWGAIMLISYLLMVGLKKVRNLGLRVELSLAALSLIIYSAGFARPYLHIIHQLDTFTRAGLRPDPMRALLSIMGFH